MTLSDRWLMRACLVLLAGLPASGAQAGFIDASAVFSNIGFENGNLSGWTLTRPNSNFVSSLSPPVNPTINPADPANDPTTLTAPVGSFFTGLTRPGDTGPDLAYKLAYDATAISAPTGAVFEVTIFANHGRLEPFDTPGSTADVAVKIFGWTAGAAPTVNAATDNWSRAIGWNPASQTFNFSSVPDGTWGQQTFTFDPAAMGIDAANLKYLAVSVTGSTHNHDQYVAFDFGPTEVVPAPASLWLSLTGVGFLTGWRHRKRHRSV